MRHNYHRRVLALLALAALGLSLVACGEAKGAAPTATEAPAANLIIMSDIVQGSKNVPADKKATQSCVLSSRFP